MAQNKLIQHPAEEYNRIRRIVFSVYNKDGFDHTKEILEGYEISLGCRGFAGLKAELCFYNKFQKEYNLTPALDSGEHVDFAGMMGNIPIRFDVTTNEKFKEFKNYEKFLCDGYEYRIAIMDKDNWEIKDVIDLAFPKCPFCGSGNLFPIAVLLGENYNNSGESQWTNDQLLLDICPYCGEFNKKNATTTHFLQKIEEYSKELDMYKDLSPSDYEKDIKEYTDSSFDFLKKEWETETVKLMGLADSKYFVTSHDGDGYWGIQFQFKKDVIRKKFPDCLATGMLEYANEEW